MSAGFGRRVALHLNGFLHVHLLKYYIRRHGSVTRVFKKIIKISKIKCVNKKKRLNVWPKLRVDESIAGFFLPLPFFNFYF